MTVAACSSKVLVISEENQQLDSGFGSMSEEMVERILSYLDNISDRYHAALTCRKFYRITAGSMLWENERAVCHKLFVSQFPALSPNLSNTWTLGAWHAMGLYRKRFSELYSESLSVRELASQVKGEDVYSFREHALNVSWEKWVAARDGLLTLPCYLNFTEYSFSLFLNALEKNEKVTGLDFNCSMTKEMINLLAPFLEKQGENFTEISIGPARRLSTQEVVALIDQLVLTPNLEELKVEQVDVDGEVIAHLSVVIDRLPKLRRLLLDCRFQKIDKIDWHWLKGVYLHPTLEHLWIKGMDDLGIQSIEPCLLITRIPKICFRSGKISGLSSNVFERLVMQNHTIRVLDLACNVYLDYDEVPELIRIIRQRPEITFGITGAPFLLHRPPSLTPKKKKLLAKLFKR